MAKNKETKEVIETNDLTEPIEESVSPENVTTDQKTEEKPNEGLIDILQFIANFSGIRMQGNYLEVAFKSYCRNNKINDRVSMDTWVKRFEHFKSSPPSKPLPEDLKPKVKQKVGG